MCGGVAVAEAPGHSQGEVQNAKVELRKDALVQKKTVDTCG